MKAARVHRSAAVRTLVAASISFSAVTLFGLTTRVEASAQTAPAGLLTYNVAVEAPVFQMTEDAVLAPFHPQGEGDFGYAYATLDPSNQHALASVLWPGAAAGNAGTLVEVLGGPSGLNALNYPVRAEALSGTGQTQQSTSLPSGTTMTATVQPPKAGDEYAAASSAIASGGLGAVGSAGASIASSAVHFDSTTGALVANAQTSASAISIDGGLVSIGSVTSSAQGTSNNGGQPSLSGTTVVHNMTIAGQNAYVDASGVHIGQQGTPAPSMVQGAVNSALQQAGMQIYFTDPTHVTIGGVDFYDASSVLFYFAVPNDPTHNSFTVSIGGAAVSMSAASTAFQGGAGSSGSPDTGSQDLAAAPTGDAVPTSPVASPVLSLPTGAIPALNAQPRVAPPNRTQAVAPANLAATSLPGGLGAGWIVFIGLAGLLGAIGLTRVPGLVASSSSGGPKSCPNQIRR